MQIGLSEGFQADVRRLGFTIEPKGLTLVRVGTHDEVRRYLRSL